jgi:unsaturated rhamnogalacturonyl hydrolase
MANDSGNCEFTNFNKLAGKFGIQFNEDRNNLVEGKKFEMGKFDNFPAHPLFNGVNKIYIKEISSLNLAGNAKPILERDGKIFMAGSKFGKGFVFAIGDPWLYNEYFDNRKLTSDFENYLAANNLVKWLLEKATAINNN